MPSDDQPARLCVVENKAWYCVRQARPKRLIGRCWRELGRPEAALALVKPGWQHCCRNLHGLVFNGAACKLLRQEMGCGNLTGVGSLSLCASSVGAASSCTG